MVVFISSSLKLSKKGILNSKVDFRYHSLTLAVKTFFYYAIENINVKYQLVHNYLDLKPKCFLTGLTGLT